jgi:hypothetical protein
MTDPRDPLPARLGDSLDRRAAVKAYVPPALAAIGLMTRTNHGASGSGGGPQGGNNGGNKSAPRSHVSVARKGGRGQNHH